MTGTAVHRAAATAAPESVAEAGRPMESVVAEADPPEVAAHAAEDDKRHRMAQIA